MAASGVLSRVRVAQGVQALGAGSAMVKMLPVDTPCKLVSDAAF